MSSAFSGLNGRGMSVRESTMVPLAVTSKQPLRGFSGLTDTVTLGTSFFTRASSFVALVLNAPHDLHASISRNKPVSAAALPTTAGDACFFLLAVDASPAAALRFGGILFARMSWAIDTSR
eukprot:CAMPEP_0183332860 /NCGR_PEP_ID=MMETSP0164_2-20130417/1917_1 /TAXON_ID=221442 /ORGANISM="Coccolithus pelagicus ssp braarudi, Strain PLY182g" /LENGTH=120 /DNA_ID=CAMNT_0025501667 /DNA_START=395 /DNA_END=753 /DNA_ORIENTATION=+